jgi:hypothetical protein
MRRHVENFESVPAQVGPALDEAQSAQYRRQQIIEVVCDAARQLANGVQLLDLQQLILHVPLFRHIAKRTGNQTAAICKNYSLV